MDEEKEVINFINRGQEPESKGTINAKGFRVELDYNAKTLNSEYRFYLIKDDASSERVNREAQSDLCQNLHL